MQTSELTQGNMAPQLRRAWFGMLIVAQLLCTANFVWGETPEPGAPISPAGPAAGQPVDPQSPEQQWGVKIIGIRLAAAGYMLDFRYRVIDPVKAGLLFDPQFKPCLTDQGTGARMMVPAPPKIGPLRSSGKAVLPNRVYFIMFANPGQYIKAGNKVTVEIGAFKITDLVVQ